MTARIILVLALVAAGFLGGWKTQGWRHEAAEKQRVEQVAEHNIEVQRMATRAQTRVIEAQNAAAERLDSLRVAAAGARAERDRLRDAASASIAAARSGHQACIANASALAEVFGQCAGRYVDLAEKADGHVSDIQTMTDAWPGP
jgi:hypothetical protein